MKELITTFALGIFIGVAASAALPNSKPAPVSVPREEVVTATLPQARDDAPATVSDDATDDSQTAAISEEVALAAVSLPEEQVRTETPAFSGFIRENTEEQVRTAIPHPAPAAPPVLAIQAFQRRTTFGSVYSCGPGGCALPVRGYQYQQRRAILPRWRR